MTGFPLHWLVSQCGLAFRKNLKSLSNFPTEVEGGFIVMYNPRGAAGPLIDYGQYPVHCRRHSEKQDIFIATYNNELFYSWRRWIAIDYEAGILVSTLRISFLFLWAKVMNYPKLISKCSR